MSAPGEDHSIRCPGGYLVRTLRHLCGRSGNQCRGECAYAWRNPKWYHQIELVNGSWND